MIKKNDSIIILSVYLVAAFFAFPILRYILLFTLQLDPLASDEFVLIRVFLSGPVLILLGFFLSTNFKGIIHRFFGILFLLGGCAWIIVLIETAITEAG